MKTYGFCKSYYPAKNNPNDFDHESDLIDWGVEPEAEGSLAVKECENKHA